MKFPANKIRAAAAFTMVEIAICLAIIGIALVAIIGVLPMGMNTQRDNREETIINQDATVLLEAVRNGSRGADDLTNYVYAITNSWALYNANGSFLNSGINGYTYLGANVNGTDKAFYSLTNGANIIGLLSTPEFADASNGLPIPNVYQGGYSNHVVAYVRALSGIAAEKPPQDSQILQQDTFGYRLYCVNAAEAVDTNVAFQGFVRELNANQHELRMTFYWPQRANGTLGNGRQTYRATIAGQLTPDRTNTLLYFYQPQSFRTNSVNAP